MLKKKINYKLVCNKRNEDLKNEILTLFGKKDTIFSVGKYFDQMGGRSTADEIKRSSVQISVNG